MRWVQVLLSSLLSSSVGVLAAKKASPSTAKTFDDFHALSQAATPLKVEDASYKQLTHAPRDYAAAVLLTAMDNRFGCQLCREFQPEWDLLARSWIKGDKNGESRLVFGTLDFNDGRETFMSLGLQTAPVLLFFPPTTGPHAEKNTDARRYDFTSGAPAEQVHAWIARHMPNRPHPAVKRPINWMRWAVTMTAIAGVGTAGTLAWPYVMPIVQNRNIWAAFSLISILLFTSGHMFNRIRNVPYVAGDQQGRINYFASGFQSQFGLETQIVAAIYGLLSFAAISLALKAPRIADPKAQQVAIVIWGGVVFVVYSFLLSVFRIKNAGYPFFLPPFM